MEIRLLIQLFYTFFLMEIKLSYSPSPGVKCDVVPGRLAVLIKSCPQGPNGNRREKQVIETVIRLVHRFMAYRSSWLSIFAVFNSNVLYYVWVFIFAGKYHYHLFWKLFIFLLISLQSLTINISNFIKVGILKIFNKPYLIRTRVIMFD